MKKTIIHVGGVAEVLRSFGDFLDGKSAQVNRVAIRIDDTAKPSLVVAPPEGAEIYWPLDDLRLVPDQADRTHLVVRPSWAGPARLMVEDAQTQAILRARCANLAKRPPAKNPRRLLGWSLGAVASVALIVFALVPLMADQLAVLLPPRGEQALGDATLGQIRKALSDNDLAPVAFCENPKGVAALAEMQALLEDQTDLPYPLQVHVLDHAKVNAFALPGGHIVLFRGLIDAAKSPDEVASVFAHEIGHVVNRDPARGALRSAGSIGVLGLMFGDFAGGTVVLFMLNRLIDATYSQDAEAAADQFAYGVLAAAGVRPSALATMFERLLEKHGESSGLVQHFQAHPKLGNRIADARAADGQMQTDPRRSLDDAAWRDLQRICQSGDTPVDNIKNKRGS